MGYYGMWDPNPMGYDGTSGPQSYGLLWDVGPPCDLCTMMGCGTPTLWAIMGCGTPILWAIMGRRDPNPMGYYGMLGTPRDLWAIMGCAPLWVGTHWQCGPAVDTLQWPLLQSMVWAVLGAQAVTQRTVGPEVTA